MTAEDSSFMANEPQTDKSDRDPSELLLEFNDESFGFLNALHASTEAEHHMHALARVALLNLLSTDPTVVRRHSKWMHATRHGRAVFEFVEQFGRCAETLGLENAGAFMQLVKSAPADGMVTIQAEDESDAEHISKTINAQVARANELFDEVVESSGCFESEFITDEAITLVRDEWKLPWPWVANELVRLWILRMHSLTYGIRFTQVCWAESDPLDRPAPSAEFTFASKPDETIRQALERFLRETKTTIVHPFVEASAPLPKGTKTREAIAVRYVEWWYRKNILAESIRSIAGKDDDKRALVRRGIRRAELWLNVSNCVWKDQAAA
jgi:hypothetical protein